MGYTTYFDGCFELDRPLEHEHAEYLKKFAQTRRMQRHEGRTERRYDPVREAADLPVGPEGAYFVGEGGDFGQGDFRRHSEHGEVGIVDYNRPPSGQPSLWCQWVPGQSNAVKECPECKKKRKKGDYQYKGLKEGKCPRCNYAAPLPVYDVIEWDEGEKFYSYVEWIKYLIEHFLRRWGYVLNGEVSWQGEEGPDRGVIYIKDNRVQPVEDKVIRPAPQWD